jgi:vacuolar-type H+-ATPase subunit E/Vma4
MGLDVLLASLRRDARAEREEVLAAARTAAETLSADSGRRLDEQRDAVIARERARLSADAERRLGAARRAARDDVLRARQELLDRVFAAARGLLPDAGLTDAYRAALPARLARALTFAGGGPVEVLCPAALVPSVRELVASREEVRVRVMPDILAGLRVRSADGRVEVEDTLEARLEAERAELSRGVLADLASP